MPGGGGWFVVCERVHAYMHAGISVCMCGVELYRGHSAAGDAVVAGEPPQLAGMQMRPIAGVCL